MRRQIPTATDPGGAPPPLPALRVALAKIETVAFEAAPGEILHEAGDPLATVHLVGEGVAALVARAPGGAMAEVGLIGPGGLVGHAAALGAEVATSAAVALVGVRGIAFESATLTRLADERPDVRRELAAYAAERFAELERLCVCATAHSIERRLARWLVTAATLLKREPIEITHRRFAELLGVRRASVTTSLHLLEGEMAIRCRRGQVEIRDLARLEAASCGCHLRPPPAGASRR